MARLLSIGEFARITHLSVKTLRHYAEEKLLEPAHVDEETGYRRYALEQLPIAQVIRRLRALDVSIPDVRAALGADLEARRQLLLRHLDERERALAQLQGTVSTLRALLSADRDAPAVVYRSLPATPALAIRALVERRELRAWWHGATAELHATLRALQVRAAGPLSGQYESALLTDERGEALVYLPIEGEPPRALVGRIASIVVPAVELAVLAHRGAHADLDVTYAELARHVLGRELGVEGPIREAYVRGPVDSPNEEDWLTEIGWPIFRTAG